MSDRRALDIAKYLVNYHIDSEVPLTPLTLQKVLYLAWVDYYNKTGESLFHDYFVADGSGPTIPKVADEYRSYGSDMIFRYSSGLRLPWLRELTLDECLVEYEYMTASDLAKICERKGGAWDEVFRNGKGIGQIIPFDLVIKLDCNRQGEKQGKKGDSTMTECLVDIEALEDKAAASVAEAIIAANEYAIDVLKRAREGGLRPFDEAMLPIVLENLLGNTSVTPCYVCGDDEDFDEDWTALRDEDGDRDNGENSDEIKEALAELKNALAALKDALA